MQPTMGVISNYLPERDDPRQDLLSDSIKRLEYLASLAPGKNFPFTCDQVKVLKMSNQANKNAQICLDWGYVPFCLIASSIGLASCLTLTNYSPLVQASLGCADNCAGSLLGSSLGLIWGGRNTNTSSNQNNYRQDTLDSLEKEFYILSYDLIKLYKDRGKRMDIHQLAKLISMDTLRSSAATTSLTQKEADKIFRTFEAAVNYTCERPWRNIEIEKMLKD